MRTISINLGELGTIRFSDLDGFMCQIDEISSNERYDFIARNHTVLTQALKTELDRAKDTMEVKEVAKILQGLDVIRTGRRTGAGNC
jgi:hypothetical protein